MSEVRTFLHEIKNELNNIYGLIEILKEENKEENETMNLIQTSVMQIKNIETDFHEYIKIGKVQVNNELIESHSFIKEIIAHYEREAAEKKINLEVQLENVTQITDKTKFRQIIDNLLSNAIKYNKSGGKIWVTLNKINDKLVFIIKDSGIGMTEKEIASLGKPFYRCKKIDTDGSGLGWPTIIKLTKMLNWKVYVESCDGLKVTIEM